MPYDADEIYECCFPDACLLPGLHFREACYTIEMAKAFETAVEMEAFRNDDTETICDPRGL
jgi:hypothetical protein